MQGRSREFSTRSLVENQVVVVTQQMIWRDPTAGGGAHHCGAIGTLKVGLHGFIVTAIAAR